MRTYIRTQLHNKTLLDVPREMLNYTVPPHNQNAGQNEMTVNTFFENV
jgi:hypothetical protein